LKRVGIKILKDKEWKIEDRIVMKEGYTYQKENSEGK